MDIDLLKMLNTIQQQLTLLVTLEQHPTKALILSQISYSIKHYIDTKGDTQC